MKIINDSTLLDAYCSSCDIKSHFDSWGQLTKVLARYEKGERITLYGDRADKLFFLIEGAIKFSCITDNYEEFFFFDAKNDGLFGEVEYALKIPLITQSEVVEDAVCVLIPFADNEKYLDQDLTFQKFVRNVLAKKYNDIRRHYMDIETYPLDVRVARYLLMGREGSMISNLKKIAEDVGGSYRQINRVFAGFCENGCLEHLPGKGKYRMADREALETLVETYINRT